MPEIEFADSIPQVLDDFIFIFIFDLKWADTLKSRHVSIELKKINLSDTDTDPEGSSMDQDKTN